MARVSLKSVAIVVLGLAISCPTLLMAADPVPAAASPAPGSTPPARPARDKVKGERLVITLQYTPAFDIAKTLSNHFQGSDADVRIVADSMSNSLLISAPAPEADEVKALVQVLDRRPKSVVVEATVLEGPPAGDPAAQGKGLDDRQYNGPAAKVAAKVAAKIADDLKAGRIKSIRKLQLRTINNQLAQANSNEGHDGAPATVPTAPGKPAARQVGQGAPGTVLTTTARITDDDHVVMEVIVVDSRLRTQREMEQLLEARAAGQAVNPQSNQDSMLTTRALTTVTIKSGEAIVVHAGATNSTSQPSQVLVIVSAEVVK